MAKVPPRNPNYSAADLWPPGSQGVEFPPAAFHPVYLGNFLCQQYSELVPRVQQYFASKGLLVRMVFSRGADTDPFRAYQDKTKLYDCLVYFTRPEDAQDAIKYLHRDKYFGHRLNIFPGRKGTFFSAIKTVQVDHLPGVCDDAPAQIFEDEIRRITSATLICCIRNTPNQVLVEFQTQAKRDAGLRDGQCREGVIMAPIAVKNIKKQRYVEDDVKWEMRMRMEFVYDLPAVDIRKALAKRQKVPEVRPKYPVRGAQPQQPGNHDHVIQAMKRVQTVAAQRQLDINLYRAMFPNAYKQFMAVLQASYGDPRATEFLQTYVPPFLRRPESLTPWEWRHWELHNEGLEYVRGVVRQREYNLSRRLANEFLQ